MGRPRKTWAEMLKNDTKDGSGMIWCGLTSHSTQYRSFRRPFYGSDDPTNSVTALRTVVSRPIRLSSLKVNEKDVTKKFTMKVEDTEAAKPSKTKARQSRPTCKNCTIIIVHNTVAQRQFSQYSPDQRHTSYKGEMSLTTTVLQQKPITHIQQF